MRIKIEKGIFWLSGSRKQGAEIDKMRIKLEHELDAIVAANERLSIRR